MERDEEIRAAALDAALYYHHGSCTDDARVLRQQVVETARRFEEYIKDGT